MRNAPNDYLHIEDNVMTNSREAYNLNKYGDFTKNHAKCSVLTILRGLSCKKSGVLGIEAPHTCLWEDIREYSVIRKPRINYLVHLTADFWIR